MFFGFSKHSHHLRHESHYFTITHQAYYKHEPGEPLIHVEVACSGYGWRRAFETAEKV